MAEEKKEIQAIVKMLERHIAEYLDVGLKMKINVEVNDVLEVIDRLIFHAEGVPHQRPKGDSPRDYFLDGLYEELSTEPQNVFEKKKNEKGEEEFLPLSNGIWKACLHELKKSVATL